MPKYEITIKDEKKTEELPEKKKKEPLPAEAITKTRELVFTAVTFAFAYSCGYLLIEIIKTLMAEYITWMPVIYYDLIIIGILIFLTYLAIIINLNLIRRKEMHNS